MTELVERVERRLTFNLAQAVALVEMFDGDEELEVTVSAAIEPYAGHSGHGLYACEAEYPEEG